MTQDEIIRMAREAGWQYADGDDGYKPLWRFAALVAAHEREQLLANDESLTLAYMVGSSEGRLAEQAEQRSDSERMEPVKCVKCNAEVPLYKNGMCEVCDFGSNQAEQEPVVKIHKYNEFQTLGSLNLPIGTKLYAASVRTKDLTDDEIEKAVENIIFDENFDIKIARAVIAADREKNK